MAIYLGKDPVQTDDYIFVSYKKENCDKLTEIVSKLDFDIWYDNAIEKSADWEEEITTHLIESKAVVFFLSKDFFKEGKESFPVGEYETAKEENKKMYFVYLEKIDKRTDIPRSIRITYESIIAKQCIGYEGNLSSDETVSIINETIAKLPVVRGDNPTQKPIPIKEYHTTLHSNIFNDTIRYLGCGDCHLSDDLQKICLYNSENDLYEVRDTDDMNTVIYDFALAKPIFSKPVTPNDCRIFYSDKNEYIFYAKNDEFHTYDVINRKWHTHKPTFAKNEHPQYLSKSDVSNCVILICGNNKYFTSIKVFDISQGMFNQSWDVRPYNLCNRIVGSLKNNEIFWILFTDSSDNLKVLDMRNANISTVEQSHIDCIRDYFNQPYHTQTNVDFNLSRDGLLFSTNIVNGWRIKDSVSGATLCDIHAGTAIDACLLKNKTVLQLCPNGSVLRKTFQGTQTVFSPQYFLDTSEFEQQIPHTMHYDEEQDNYIFIVRVKSEQTFTEKMVVVNKNGRIVGTSTYMHHPFSKAFCECKIIRDKLCIMFRSGDGSLYKGNQETVVYMCKYRRKG